ncbi:hypothetical protein TI03_02160 [Achromatium sp. WMS1]|nr:hypothetical protein TI03_02160 [Achromatium sp. WMS1]
MPAALTAHLYHLIKYYPIVLPGEQLDSTKLSICLTFDDATVDFYHCVFPLLQKLSCPALLAIPTAWLTDRTDVPMEQRLAAQNVAAQQHSAHNTPEALCTWEEVRTMQASGYVHIAAHGHQHLDMRASTTDIIQELVISRTTLQQQLGQTPTTFVYPYGHTNMDVHTQVKQYYTYAMRIGSACNAGWSGNNGLLYRVDAEKFWPNGHGWSLTDIIQWRIKYTVNRLRNK